jgi:hypothetical protein
LALVPILLLATYYVLRANHEQFAALRGELASTEADLTAAKAELAALKATPARKPKLTDALLVEGVTRRTTSHPGAPTWGGNLCLTVRNQTDNDVPNCRVRLLSLHQWFRDAKDWYREDLVSELTLEWSASDGGGFSQTIPGRSDRTCDVARYTSIHDTWLQIATADPALRGQNRLLFDRYLLWLRVEADGYLPFDLDAEFEWGPDGPIGMQVRLLKFTRLEERAASPSQ